eukprot:m.215142 g.215142  ORF g.215142 m.215142 type:complete len:156 (-) comp15589_c2_seq1:45-512(-)
MGCCCSRGPATTEEEGPLLEDSPPASSHESPPRPLPASLRPLAQENVVLRDPGFDLSSLVGQQMSEQFEAQLRASLLQCLPSIIYDKGTRLDTTECTICMCEYHVGVEVRFLSCMHSFHRSCVDGWLVRKFACPICGVPPITDDSGAPPRAFLSL